MKCVINLRKHARAGNVIKNSVILLQKLTCVILNKDLNKKIQFDILSGQMLDYLLSNYYIQV